MCHSSAIFRLFFAAGITQPFCRSACAFGFRKFCEEGASMMHESSNLEILIWIGEVSFGFSRCINVHTIGHYCYAVL